MKLSASPKWDIPSCENWQRISPISKGWSNDEKYKIEDLYGEVFLLRISAREDLKREATLYEALAKLRGRGLSLPDLLDTGYCLENQKTYRLFSWVPGEELQTELLRLPPKKQYELGRQAGALLQQIHQISAPEDHTPWSSYLKVTSSSSDTPASNT